MTAVAPEKRAALIGKFADCESMLALRDMLATKAVDARTGTEYVDAARQAHLFNTPFAAVKNADALLTVGVDLQSVLPAVDFLIRQNPMPKKEITDLSALESETLFDTAKIR